MKNTPPPFQQPLVIFQIAPSVVHVERAEAGAGPIKGSSQNFIRVGSKLENNSDNSLRALRYLKGSSDSKSDGSNEMRELRENFSTSPTLNCPCGNSNRYKTARRFMVCSLPLKRHSCVGAAATHFTQQYDVFLWPTEVMMNLSVLILLIRMNSFQQLNIQLNASNKFASSKRANNRLRFHRWNKRLRCTCYNASFIGEGMRQ